MSASLSPLARGLLLIVLAIGTLSFGAVGLCGGYFTVRTVPALFSPGGASWLVLLTLSLPCLIGGLFMVVICVEKIRNVLRQPPMGRRLHE
jgi:hypothetical protein